MSMSLADKVNALWQARTNNWSTITDPGASGVIASATSGICNLSTTAAAEARTMAAPTFNGQMIILVVTETIAAGTDTVVVTFPADVNDTLGDDKLTLSAVYDGATFVAVDVSGTLTWRYIGAESHAEETKATNDFLS